MRAWLAIFMGGLASVAVASVGCATSVQGVGGGDSASGTGGAGGAENATAASTAASTSVGVTSAASTGSGGAGACTVAADCAALVDACNAGTCINGVCAKTPANDFGACDDGKFCTANDVCQSGVCIGGSQTACPSSDSCHLGACNEATDMCEVVPGNDGGNCDDGDPCTGLGVCSGGVCGKGSPVNCSVFDGPCAVGKCNPQKGCQPVPLNDGQPCDDNLFCTVNDACLAGACVGQPNTCAAPGDVCLVGACNEAMKACSAVAGNNGGACDDKNACTKSEACANGVCVNGQPTNQGGSCDDGKACTQNDACTNGVCAGTPIVACASGDGCCPAGCTLANDDDCNCNVNLALTATPSFSGGGTTAPYTLADMNDGVGQSSCLWAWVNDNVAPSGAYIEYDWPAAVTIASFYVDTENGLNPGPPCNGQPGRNLKSGTVQWWNGGAWVTSTTFSNQHDDVQIDLPVAVTTTKLRIFDMTTDPGNGNTEIFEWHVYGSPGCMPPP